MSTRGTWGFKVDGELKLTYNQMDSYPGGLGEDILTYLRSVDLQKLREDAKRLKLVTEESLPPTEEQQEELLQYANQDVSSGKLNEWYVLLRKTQGDIEATFQSGYMLYEDYAKLGEQEWSYLIDLDANTFQIWASSSVVSTFPLDALPSGLDEEGEATGFEPAELPQSVFSETEELAIEAVLLRAKERGADEVIVGRKLKQIWECC